MLSPPQIPGLRGCKHRRGRFLSTLLFYHTLYILYILFLLLLIYLVYNDYTYSERTLTMPRAVYIGENLERLRLRAALSQIELAKKAGVTPAAVNRIERNRVEPQMRTVRKLAKALGVEPHVLIEGP